MKKVIALFLISMILLTFGVVAESEDEVKNIVKKVAEKKGVNDTDFETREVDPNDLPSQLKINEIYSSNVKFYEIKSKQDNNPVFAVTGTGNNLPVVKKETVSRQLLNFGLNEKTNESEFLVMGSGVTSSLERGYVMSRSGSITGISTNLEVYGASGQDFEIVILKNGEEIAIRNEFMADGMEVKSAYASQSEGVVEFVPGDIISVYLRNTSADVGKLTTLVEVTSN